MYSPCCGLTSGRRRGSEVSESRPMSTAPKRPKRRDSTGATHVNTSTSGLQASHPPEDPRIGGSGSEHSNPEVKKPPTQVMQRSNLKGLQASHPPEDPRIGGSGSEHSNPVVKKPPTQVMQRSNLKGLQASHPPEDPRIGGSGSEHSNPVVKKPLTQVMQRSNLKGLQASHPPEDPRIGGSGSEHSNPVVKKPLTQVMQRSNLKGLQASHPPEDPRIGGSGSEHSNPVVKKPLTQVMQRSNLKVHQDMDSAEMKELRKKLRDTETHLLDTENELNDVKAKFQSEISKLSRTCKRPECASGVKQLESLQSEVKLMKEQHEATLQESTSQFSRREQEYDELLQAKSTECAQLNSQKQQLQQSLEEQKRNAVRIFHRAKELQECLTKSEMEKGVVMRDNAKLKQKVQSVEATLTSLQSEVKLMKEQHEATLQDATRQLSWREQEHKELLQAKLTECAQLNSQKQQLQQSLEEQNRNAMKIFQQAEKFQEDLSKFATEKGALLCDNAKLEQKARSVEATLTSVSGQLQNVKETCKSHETTISQLKRKIDEANLEVQQKKESIERFRKQAESAIQKLQSKTNEMEQLKKQPCPSEACKNVQLRDLKSEMQVVSKAVGAEPLLPKLEHITEMMESFREMMKSQNGTTAEERTLEETCKAHAKEKEFLESELHSMLHAPKCSRPGCQQLQREKREREMQAIGLEETCKALAKEKQVLEREVSELQSVLHAPKCNRPECQQLQREKREREMQAIGKASPGKALAKMTGGEHNELIQKFEELTSSPDGLLGKLEDCCDEFDASRTLCLIFQSAYDACTKKVLETVRRKLKCLFTVNASRSSKEGMEDVSRAFGLLLHATELKVKSFADSNCNAIAKQLCNLHDLEQYQNVKQVLDQNQDLLRQAVALTWQFVTLPCPLIASTDPDKFDDRLHDKNYGYWEDSHDHKGHQLVYTRPIVYRCYQGIVACKGYVANTTRKGESSRCRFQ